MLKIFLDKMLRNGKRVKTRNESSICVILYFKIKLKNSRYCRPKLTDLIVLTIDEASPKDVFNVTLCLSIRSTLQKLSQWIKINLNETIFYEDFKNRDFRKRLHERSLLSVSAIDLDQTKFCNNTIIDFKDDDLNDVYNHVIISELFNEIKVSSCLNLNCWPWSTQKNLSLFVRAAWKFCWPDRVLNKSTFTVLWKRFYMLFNTA